MAVMRSLLALVIATVLLVALSAPPTHAYEAAEHHWIGSSCSLKLPNADGSERTVSCGTENLQIHSESLTYAFISALAADFYGVPSKPISDAISSEERKTRFLQHFATLLSGTDVAAVKAAIQHEINTVGGPGGSASAIYKREGENFNILFNKATGGTGDSVASLAISSSQGRFMKLAERNWDHFGDRAELCYIAGHSLAVAKAIEAKQEADATARERKLRLAYAMDAYASHYLQDLFAAGHLRTPRRELNDEAIVSTKIGGLCARYMHNEDNKTGLLIQNRSGKTYTTYGDTRLFDAVCKKARGEIVKAIARSVEEVWTAFRTGSPTIGAPSALRLLPDRVALMRSADDPNTPNISPLFRKMNGKLLRRNDVSNLYDRNWTRVYTLSTTVASYEASPPTLPVLFMSPSERELISLEFDMALEEQMRAAVDSDAEFEDLLAQFDDEEGLEDEIDNEEEEFDEEDEDE